MLVVNIDDKRSPLNWNQSLKLENIPAGDKSASLKSAKQGLFYEMTAYLLNLGDSRRTDHAVMTASDNLLESF